MKVNHGATCRLVNPADWPYGDDATMASADVPTSTTASAGAPRQGTRRPAGSIGTAMAALIGTALAGCATSPPEPLRIQPNYRVDHRGLSPAEGYIAMARHFEGESRQALALLAYRNAARAAPEDPDVMNTLGMALAERAQFAAAVIALRHAVSLAPDRAPLHNNLGYALLLDGQFDAARVALNEALNLQVGYRQAQDNLARIDAAVKAAAAPTQAAPQARAMAPTPATAPSTTATLATTVPNVAPLEVNSVASIAPAADQRLPASPVPAEPAVAPSRLAVETQARAPLPATADQVAPRLDTTVTARVEISNGNGVTGMAAWMGGWLRTKHIAGAIRLTNQSQYDHATTVVVYAPGFAAQAQALAARLPRAARVEAASSPMPRSDVQVVLGHDIRTATACDTACPSFTPTARTTTVAGLTLDR